MREAGLRLCLEAGMDLCFLSPRMARTDDDQEEGPFL